MGEANPTAFNLAELTLNAQGAQLQAGARWSIGKPINASTTEVLGLVHSGLLRVSMSTSGGVESVECPFTLCIPEP